MESKLMDGVETLISSATTATGRWVNTAGCASERTFQAAVDGTGAVSATVVVEVSNDGVHATLLHTFALSGTTTDLAAAVSQHRWAWTRARVTAISGTGAVATCTVGV